MEAIIYNKHDLRPCMVQVYHGRNKPPEDKRAFFHGFITRAQPIPPAIMQGGHHGGQVVAPYALIELEDGQVYEVEPRDIRFLDTKGLMEQYAWGEEAKQ